MATLALAGSLAWLNPDQEAFESYATQQLSGYIEDNLCKDLAAPLEPFIVLPCEKLLDENQDLLDRLIRDRTQRYNYVLFSIYRTTLILPLEGILPSYHIDTLGIWGQFYTINISRK